MSYTADGLDPYTHYLVKVVVINGKGEGHPVNETVWTDEEGTTLRFKEADFSLYCACFCMRILI